MEPRAVLKGDEVDDDASTALVDDQSTNYPEDSPAKAFVPEILPRAEEGREAEAQAAAPVPRVPEPGPEPGPRPQQLEPWRPRLAAYLTKFAGAGVAGAPRPPLKETVYSLLGTYLGIAVLGFVQSPLLDRVPAMHVFLLGSFGAMAVIIFSVPKAPVAQPYNVLVGNTLGGIVGFGVVEVMGIAGLEHVTWLAGALAVSLTIVAQELTRSQHPPGGATALLYVIVTGLHTIGWRYVLWPVLAGSVLMVIIALFTNNLSSARIYPQAWPCGCGGPPDELEADGDARRAQPSALRRYFAKFAGAGVAPAPRPPPLETLYSFLGSFVGIATLGLLQKCLLPTLAFHPHMMLFTGNFGAMAVLIFSLPKAPVSQPKNAILGDTIGGLVGVAVVRGLELAGLGNWLWMAAALAVALTVALQELAAAVHPPGGAAALIFVLRTCGLKAPLQHDRVIYEMGNWFALCPAFMGAVIIVAVGMVMNNLSDKRVYPQGWW